MKKSNQTLVKFDLLNVAKSTLMIFAVILSVYVLFRITDIIIIFLASFFIAAALDPIVDYLQHYKIPRALSVILLYLIAFILTALFLSSLLPIINDQLLAIIRVVESFIKELSNENWEALPFGQYLKVIDTKSLIEQLQSIISLVYQQVIGLGGNIWTFLILISNGLMNLIIVFVLVFFITVDEAAIEKACKSLFPVKYGEYVSSRLQMIKNKIGFWIRGQLMVSLITAIITWVGLSVVGIKYALIHSIIVGILMVVPIFGRLFAWIVSFPIILSQSPGLAFYMTIYYLAVSQAENNFLIPYLMKKAVGLNPIIIIFSLMVGFNFFGILGLIFAVPVATIFALFIKDVNTKMKSKKA
ncbi:AI-2E family transporter [Candidatus Peregrinibacteria bacterium]|nr:AI-2E family transporter [Candidatus Peregrinibacteria bacterium]